MLWQDRYRHRQIWNSTHKEPQHNLKYNATRFPHQRQSCSLQTHIRMRPCRHSLLQSVPIHTQTQSICFIALLLPYTKDRGNALNRLLVTIYCYEMLTAVKWLTGVAKGPDPTRRTLAVSSHGVTTATIQALALLLALETMITLRTGCWKYMCKFTGLVLVILYHITDFTPFPLLRFSQYVPVQPGKQVQAPLTCSHAASFSHWHLWRQPWPKKPSGHSRKCIENIRKS